MIASSVGAEPRLMSCIPLKIASYPIFDFLTVQTSARIKSPHSCKDFRLLQLRVRK
jgi:hypothetical protein